jgi:hypothetical protein
MDSRDFRSRRELLASKAFALSSSVNLPPSDLITEETWNTVSLIFQTMLVELVTSPCADGGMGSKHLPVTEEFRLRGRLLADAGQAAWDKFMTELRETHLGVPVKSRGVTFVEWLQSTYDAGMARREKKGLWRPLALRRGVATQVHNHRECVGCRR